MVDADALETSIIPTEDPLTSKADALEALEPEGPTIADADMMELPEPPATIAVSILQLCCSNFTIGSSSKVGE